MNTQKLLPKDKQGNVIQLTPVGIALARTVDADVSSSTEIVLNSATTMIRVYAIAQDVYMKWGADNVDATNFDEVIVAGQVFDFVVPDGYTAINLIERVSGAGVIVIER